LVFSAFSGLLSRIILSTAGLLTLVLSVMIDATGSATVPNLFLGMDKVVHFLIYGLMALLCVNLLSETELGDPVFIPLHAIVFTGIVGLLVEILQSHSPGRQADVSDLLADIFGAIVFTFIWYRRKNKDAFYR